MLVLPCEAMHYDHGRAGITIILARPLRKVERETLIESNPDLRLGFPDKETITIQ